MRIFAMEWRPSLRWLIGLLAALVVIAMGLAAVVLLRTGGWDGASSAKAPSWPEKMEIEHSETQAESVAAGGVQLTHETPSTLPEMRPTVCVPTTQSLKWMHAPISPLESGRWDGEAELGSVSLDPVTDGIVLLGGKFIPPPYRIARIGACEFINGELYHHASYWRKSGLDIEEDKRTQYVIACLQDDVERLHAMLSANSIVNISYKNLPEAGVVYSVGEIRQEDISEDTYKWGEMLASRKAIDVRLHLSREMGKARAGPFSTGPVCFTKMSEEEIIRFDTSDRARFLRRLRAIVDKAVAERSSQLKEEEDTNKRSADEYDRLMREQQRREEEGDKDANVIKGRPGFTYMGDDADGQPVWVPNPPELNENTKGTLLFADSHVLDDTRTDSQGRTYFPVEEWRAKGWLASEQASVPGRPWWFNNGARLPDASWYALPWEEKNISSWARKVGLGVVLDGHWKAMLQNVSADPLTEVERKELARRNRDGEAKISEFVFYQMRVAVVVSQDSPLRSISGPEIYDLMTSNPGLFTKP